MQTFLPYPDYQKSAACLDKRRCWKQVLEARQLINGSFPNHPAAKMWRGYGNALKQYYNVFLLECLDVRGIDTTLTQEPVVDVIQPSWLGNEEFHSCHRVALLTKDPVWYGRFGWAEKVDYNYKYLWPKGERK